MAYFSVIFFSLFNYILYFTLFVSVSCLVIYFRVYVRQVKEWKRSNIPFLQPKFLIGHRYFWRLRTQSPTVIIDQIYRENDDKDLVAFFMTTVPEVFIRDPKLIQNVFSKCFDKTYLTGFSVAAVDEETKHMIISANERDTWKYTRTVVAPLFLNSRIRGPEYGKMLKKIDPLWRHSEEKRQSGQPLNVQHAGQNFIVDGISNWYYGEDINSYERSHALHQIVSEVFAPTVHRMINFFIVLHFPALQAFETFRIVSRAHINKMANFLRRKMDDRDVHKSNENDFVDVLRSFKNGGGRGNVSESEDGDVTESRKGMNMRQVTGLGLLFILGGTETAIGVATFATHLLSLHPMCQDKIRKETDDAMKRHGVTGFTPEVVHDLQFTEQCILEALRLFPIVPLIMRICSQDFQIPGTKYTLTKGTKVIMSPYSIHRDPRYFKDPEKFDPERFSPENRAAATAPEIFYGFSTGPRKCPGYKMGLMVTTTYVASLLHKYELRPCSHLAQMDATDFHPLSFTTLPKRELLVNLNLRDNSSPGTTLP